MMMEYKKYTQIFNRYMPVIKILLKKSIQAEQVLALDKGDFEKVGSRKAGFKFRIEFVKGRVANLISGSEIASELALAMQENEGVRNVLITNDFAVELNTRYQMKISCPNQIAPEPVAKNVEANDAGENTVEANSIEANHVETDDAEVNDADSKESDSTEEEQPPLSPESESI